MDSKTTDRPIKDPSEDLLGMTPYAFNRAAFLSSVPLPFTLGVYGEWGDGKTSFVHLLVHFLRKQQGWHNLEFIDFSAWPYTTTDAIWRALTLDLARVLYKPSSQPQPGAEDCSSDDSRGVLPSVRNFLRKDALLIREPESIPLADSEYRRVLNRLDRSAAAIASRNSRGSGVDLDSSLIAFLKIFSGVAGFFVPVLGGIRKLLGTDEGNALVQLFQAERGAVARQAVEGVEELRGVLREMFTKHGAQRRLVVFVDDLDRCLPEVTLDLLECLKIFFAEAPCLFIIAADESLVGAGLRARLRRAEGSNFVGEETLPRQGRQYFEKIIQFGVSVPQKTPEDLHRFSATQFPAWVSATDLLQIAIGSNPRRLKQQCRRLDYEFSVARRQRQATIQALFEKVVALFLLSAEAGEWLRLAACEASYSVEVEALEARCRGQEPKGDEIAERDWPALTPQVRALLLRPPLFSSSRPEEVALFAQFSDVHPALEGRRFDGRLESHDPVFVRMAALLAETNGTASTERYMVQDFSKLIGISSTYPAIGRHLEDLASTQFWNKDAEAIDAGCNGTLEEGGRQPEVSTGCAKAILAKVRRGDGKGTGRNRVRMLLASPPRLPTILKEEVLAYAKVRDQLPKIASLLHAGVVSTTPDEGKWKRLATEVVASLSDDSRGAIQQALELRRAVALELLEKRKFAKLYCLAHAWPELADRLRLEGLAGLRGLEEAALGASQRTIPADWEPWLRDQRLLRLLRLPPMLSAIFDQELQAFFSVVDILAPRPSDGEEDVAGPTVVPTLPLADEQYEAVEVVVLPAPGDSTSFQIRARDVEADRESEETKITIPFEIIQSRVREFLQIAIWGESSRDEMEATMTSRQLQSSWELSREQEAALKLTELGKSLFDCLFTNQAGKILVDAVNRSAKIRVLLEVEDVRLMSLPWESLYLPSLEVFPACSLKFSVVRYLPRMRTLLPRNLVPPLKVLAVLSSPEDVAPLEIEQERTVLERALAAAIDGGHVELRVLHSPTASSLQRELRTFVPHVFHFVGHCVVNAQHSAGALVLEDDRGRAQLVGAQDVSVMLRDFNIRLAVLNGCETGISGDMGVMAGVAGAIVGKGTPAVVATIRPIVDAAALTFSQEFYRSLADGYSIEGAVVEARKALSIRKWDWSAYALFGGLKDLDSLRLLRGRSEV